MGPISLTRRRPRVSVVIASYNAEQWVGAAVRSALAQSLEEIEVILVDDSSTDATISEALRAAEGDSRLLLVKCAGNGGPAAARNRGFSRARGDWIAVLDSDDLLAPDRLETLIAAGERSGADIVSDDLILFGEGGDLPTYFLRDQTPRWISPRAYLEQCLMFGAGQDYGYLKPAFRRSSLDTFRLSYDERLRIGEDDDFIVRLLLSGARYRCEPSKGYFYRRHSGSTSFRLSSANAREMHKAAAALANDYRSSELAHLLQRRAMMLYRALGFAELVEALQRRDWYRAARVGWKQPATLWLLWIPVRDRILRWRAKRRPKGALTAEA